MSLLRLFRVSGSSMEPILREGDIAIASSIPYLLRNPVPGDIIVALHPLIQKKHIIKRIASVASLGTKGVRIFVQGDDSLASEDSNSFGTLSEKSLIGKVIYVARNHTSKRSYEKV